MPLANEVFTPPTAEVEKARAILAAMAEAQASGAGAATLPSGVLIDAALIRQAEVIVKQADIIAAAPAAESGF